MKEKIEKVLDKIRPSMEADGGGIELVDVDEENGIVKVRLQGACFGCPMAQVTLQQGVAKEIMKAIPEIKDVIAV